MPPPCRSQEAEWLFGIAPADALAHPERVLDQGDGWRGVLVSGAGPGGPQPQCAAAQGLAAGAGRGASPRLLPPAARPSAACAGRQLPSNHLWALRLQPASASLPPPPAAGEKGSAYAFRAPGGKMAMSGTVPVLDVKVRSSLQPWSLLRFVTCSWL